MTSNRYTASRFAVLFLLGFFTLIAQTLLFRLFLTVYEGSELGVGIFFCSWLLWVAAGAGIARIKSKQQSRLLSAFDTLLFLYIPAFLIQQYIILHSRELAGVASYELFPFMRMLGLSILANAPVSFLTGFLFTLGCEWMAQTRSTPISHVYIAEALGSFTGGILVTLLLVCRMTPENIFMLIVLMLSLQLFIFRWRQKPHPALFIPILLVLICIVSGVPKRWTSWRHTTTWQRLLPKETYLGHFTTAQADYLYGADHGQFNVMAWESIIESIPNNTYGREVAALTMAQHPTATNILVLGAGSYSICNELLKLPQITNITWLATDPAYPRILLKHLPTHDQRDKEQIEVPPIDIQRFLNKHHTPFDIIIIHLPDVTTLALNRYFTLNFYSLLKDHLRPQGIACIRATGGENYMGPELTDLGASIYATLHKVFPFIALKPGEETWFIASPTNRVSQDTAKLVAQYERIPEAAELFPPTGLHSLYLEDRAAFQMEAYQQVVQNDTDDLLINTDETPRALLHALLFAGQHENANLSFRQCIKALQRSGWMLILCSTGLFFLLRIIYIRNEYPKQTTTPPSPTDSRILIWTTGFTGMALNILLMYLYQAEYGSIFLNIGLISSLFMAGIFTGSSICNHEAERHNQHITRLLIMGLSLHILLCAGLYLRHDLSAIGYMFMFLMAGFMNGIYIPIAAVYLSANKIPTRQAGSLIETGDNLGGSAGGFICGIILLPIFGTTTTLLFLASLLFINFASIFARRSETSSAEQPSERTRPIVCLGYILTGIAILLLISNQVIPHEEKIEQETEISKLAHNMAPTQIWHGKSFPLDDTIIEYAESDAHHYFFTTEILASGITGYSGPIVLALTTDKNGMLINFAVLASEETTTYMRQALKWAEQLKGKNIFQKEALANIDALTGATFTTQALKNIIQTAGLAFSNGLNKKQPHHTQTATPRNYPVAPAILFLCLCCCALILRHKSNPRTRLVYLIITVIVAGFIFNIQYSLDHIFLLLELQIPIIGLSLPFLLVVIVPVLVVLFGNIYCGYLCPFGALQELFGDLQPDNVNHKLTPCDQTWFYLRKLKYLLLFAGIITFILLDNRDFLLWDPLISAFSKHRQHSMSLLILTILIISLFYKRFWCRVLCPTGAFLSLLNSIKLLRRFQQKLPWRLCDYGVTSEKDLDCLCCNRCLHNARSKGKHTITRSSRFSITDLVIIILTISITCWWIALVYQPDTTTLPAYTSDSWPQMSPQKASSKLPDSHPAEPGNMKKQGQPRIVDMDALRDKIERHQLSNHEALYYEEIGVSPVF